MNVLDMRTKAETELSREQLIEQMTKGDRQVDLYYQARQTDPDGYLSWDHENWTSADGKRFIRSYSLEGKTLFEYSTYNKYDMQDAFSPEKADRVELN